MLKLHQLFFRQSALIFLGVFIISAIVGYFLLRQMEIDTHKRLLNNMVLMVEKEFNSMPKDVFDKHIKETHQVTGMRITIIDKNGKVLFESNRDAKGMDNHASRPEVIRARDHEWGSSIRHSDTLGIDLLYLAHKNGDTTIRMAQSIEQINSQLLSLWLKALLLLSVVMGALFWWSNRLSKKINNDTTTIQKSLDKLLAKEYDQDYAEVSCCEEFVKIAKKISKLSQRLQKREKQKSKYTRKLKKLTKSQNDIISAISHEFKNPVAAIIGYAQSINQDQKIDPEIEKRFLTKIESNAQKISNMIDRLSLAIKLENSSLGLNKTEFELQNIVNNSIETLKHKYPNREIKANCKDITIFADRDMIENVLINLIENALKYSEDEVEIYCDGDKIEVKDHGSGIETSEIQKITDKFYRTDTLSWNNSLGLGLYIVSYILKLHNTKLEIRSEPNIGSVFGFGLDGMRIVE